MGCLPLLLLFPLGCGIGWLLTGSIGALWGGGFSLLLGFVLMGLSIRAMRARR